MFNGTNALMALPNEMSTRLTVLQPVARSSEKLKKQSTNPPNKSSNVVSEALQSKIDANAVALEYAKRAKELQMSNAHKLGEALDRHINHFDLTTDCSSADVSSDRSYKRHKCNSFLPMSPSRTGISSSACSSSHQNDMAPRQTGFSSASSTKSISKYSTLSLPPQESFTKADLEKLGSDAMGKKLDPDRAFMAAPGR